jgi:hypothetical protein
MQSGVGESKNVRVMDSERKKEESSSGRNMKARKKVGDKDTKGKSYYREATEKTEWRKKTTTKEKVNKKNK